MGRPMAWRRGADRHGLRLVRPGEDPPQQVPLSRGARLLKVSLERHGLTTEDLRGVYNVFSECFENPESFSEQELFGLIREIEGVPEDPSQT
ncbi:MAG: hypothetical protein AMXMBFR44_1570 [Candidatus Campbellbacteria bacterium]